MREKNTLTQRNFIWFSSQINKIKPLIETLWWALTYKKVEWSSNIISTKFFNSNQDNIWQADIDNVLMFIHQANEKFNILQDELDKELSFNTAQSGILSNLIKSSILNLTKIKYAVYIEAEKWWYILNEQKRNNCLKKIEEIDTILYWNKVSDSPNEVNIIINYFHSLLETNWDELSNCEKEKRTSLLNDFPISSKINYNIDNNIFPKEKFENIKIIDFAHIIKKTFDIYDIGTIIIDIDKKHDNVKVTDDTLCIPESLDQYEINQIYKQMGIEQKIKIIIDPLATNMSVRWLAKEFILPIKYWSLWLKTICGLLDHEIWTHWITFLNNEKILNILSDSYPKIQEWVAVLNQELVHTDFSKIDINTPRIWNISVFLWENHNFNDTKELLKIYFKLTGVDEEKIEKKAHTRSLRVKRFQPLDLNWANRKDVIYWRWLFDIIEYINNTNDEELKKSAKIFNQTRLWHKEIINSDWLFEGFNIDKDNIIMPIAIGKILYQKLIWRDLWDSNTSFSLADKTETEQQEKKILLLEKFIRECNNFAE